MYDSQEEYEADMSGMGAAEAENQRNEYYSKIDKLVDDYAHDYRFMEMSEDTLKKMLTEFLQAYNNVK